MYENANGPLKFALVNPPCGGGKERELPPPQPAIATRVIVAVMKRRKRLFAGMVATSRLSKIMTKSDYDKEKK
jgi:hypothetical protein